MGLLMGGRGYPGFAPYVVHAHSGHPLLWLLFLIVLAIVLGLIAAFVFRWLATRRAGGLHATVVAGAGGGDALAIVRMRYARGEIDRDQYLQTTADLAGPGWPAPPPDAPTA